MSTTATVRNGVDTEALFGALDAVKAMPEAAKFRFQATNEWVSGTHSRSTVHDFFGLGADQEHLNAWTFDSDHPTQLVGSDQGPAPVEYLLVALAGCITAGIGNIAAARGVELTRVRSTVEGDIDLNGVLGLDPTVRNGYKGIRASFQIEGGAGVEDLEKIVQRSVARSAVFDVLTNGVPVTVEVVA
ncbi:MAG: OsmC family protein [Acidimicrobiia bacterium]|nr:OsmC family protein [Acidimicrobiia bacterium]MDH4307292.1 OsmC family protein [Acidimicrobiia bacterium]MDH5294898.1 OsmC family protein [Acidimicrobiia bacterium]